LSVMLLVLPLPLVEIATALENFDCITLVTETDPVEIIEPEEISSFVQEWIEIVNANTHNPKIDNFTLFILNYFILILIYLDENVNHFLSFKENNFAISVVSSSKSSF